MNVPEEVIIKISPEVKKYLQALIIEKGADKLQGEIQAQIMADLFDRFSDYLLVNYATAMEKEKYYQFEEMLSTGSAPSEIEAFIRENTDSAKVTDETMTEFREIFLGKS